VAAFSLNEFYQRNRRVVIWVILFGLLWLLRDFFAVVFLTFVLAIMAVPAADFAMRRVKRLPHWLAVTVVYVIFLVVLASFVRFVVPSVASELNRMIGNLPAIEIALIESKNRLVGSYPTLRQPLNGFMRSAIAENRLTELDSQMSFERDRLGLTTEAVDAAEVSVVGADESPVGASACAACASTTSASPAGSAAASGSATSAASRSSVMSAPVEAPPLETCASARARSRSVSCSACGISSPW